jgi:hypothetical protein
MRTERWTARVTHPLTIGLIVTAGVLAAVAGLACSTAFTDAEDGGQRDGGSTIDSSTAGADASTDAEPDAWLGPVTMWSGTGAAPSCVGSWSTRALDAFATLNAPPATCSCACAPTGESCAPITVTLWRNIAAATCNASAPCGSATPSDMDACAPTGGSTGDECSSTLQSIDYTTSSSAPEGGSCAPQSSAVVVPASWETNARLCSYSGEPASTACGDSGVDVDCPTAPYGSSLCVYAIGAFACPSPYVVSTTLYQSHSPDNDRGCAPCTCASAPVGGSCAGGSVTLYGASSCPSTGGGVTPVTVVAGTTCATSGLRDVASAGNASPPTLTDAGACAADGGGPVGSTIPTGPITVCCTP